MCSRPHQGQAWVLKVMAAKSEKSNNKKKTTKKWLEVAVRYEGLTQGQLGHIQVPQGTLEAGDCDRGAN